MSGDGGCQLMSSAARVLFMKHFTCACSGVAVISMDMYNQGDKVVDDNFDDPRM